MPNEKIRNRILKVRKSIVYLFPIIFIISAFSFFVLGDKEKYQYEVNVEFGMDIRNQLNKFQLNSLLLETFNHIPESYVFEMNYYRENYINDLVSLLKDKTKCLIRLNKVASLNNQYVLNCIITSLSPDEIEKTVSQAHLVTNSKYVNMHNENVIKLLSYIDQRLDPKSYHIKKIATYQLEYNIKNVFKDWVLSSFFIIISIAFVLYFLCLFLLNIL